MDLTGLPVRELTYLRYAERWHWTPEQVDRLPAKFFLWGPILMDAVDAVREERARDQHP